MYKGVAYPPSTPKKLYRKVRKTVLVDSRDRSPLQTQSKYTVTLPKTLENIYSVTLRSAEVPYSWYSFSASAGNTTFKATVNSVQETITIADGNYTSTTFATAIQTALNTAFSGNKFTVTYSDSTNKLTIAHSSADTWSLDFQDTTQQQEICGSAVPIPTTTSWWGLGYFMGFYKKQYSFAAAGSVVSDFIVQLNVYNYIIMELDTMNKEDETAIDNRMSGRVDGCFAKIPITGNSGDIIFFREWCCPLNRSVLTPPLGQVRVLNIKFRHHDGRLVEFNNVDHSLSLEFELLETNFDEYSSLDFAH